MRVEGRVVRLSAGVLAYIGKSGQQSGVYGTRQYSTDSQIESVLDDTDYRSRLSRTALEESVSPLLPSFASPLSSAIASSGLSIDQITSILLFGGNTRVPLVQTALKEAIESLASESSTKRTAEDIIAQNVNTDEAAVLGAAFYGAGLSRQFRMKNIELHEKTVYDYALGVNGQVKEVVFEKGTELGERKGVRLEPVDQTIEVMQNGYVLSSLLLSSTILQDPGDLAVTGDPQSTRRWTQGASHRAGSAPLHI